MKFTANQDFRHGHDTYTKGTEGDDSEGLVTYWAMNGWVDAPDVVPFNTDAPPSDVALEVHDTVTPTAATEVS